MKSLLLITVAGGVSYFALKLFLCIYRLFFLSKTFQKIEGIYSKLLAGLEKDLNAAIENYSKWQAGDDTLRRFRAEEEILKDVETAKREKAHEEEVHEKFLRARERFSGDRKRLSEAIAAYQRYLSIKVKQRQNASLFAIAVTSEGASLHDFDEMTAAARETMVALEENERKLDILLS